MSAVNLLKSWLTSISMWQEALGLVLITVSLLVYGVLQERIVTIGFGEHKEMFEDSFFLVLCNRLCTCVMALSYMMTAGVKLRPEAPLIAYASVSITNVIATSCQYEALKYVSFAVQTLAKTAKTLPVMLWGTLIAGKRYKVSEYFHSLVITVGCAVFLMTGSTASRIANLQSQLTYLTGAFLMCVYLCVDGLTSTYQEALFSTYHMGICDQVLYTTACSACLSLLGTIATRQLVPSLLFFTRHPDAIWWILALSVSSGMVQLLISYTIKAHGAVVFATIMTTRQFFSILLSSLIFWTPLSSGQWFGTAMVFSALYVKMLMRVWRQLDPSPLPEAKATLKVFDRVVQQTQLKSHSRSDLPSSDPSLIDEALDSIVEDLEKQPLLRSSGSREHLGHNS